MNIGKLGTRKNSNFFFGWRGVLVGVAGCGGHARWVMQGGSCDLSYARWIMRGGLCEVGHVRWVMRGGSHKVDYVRWIMQGGLREVDYARYESPSEMFHSLIFTFFLYRESGRPCNKENE